MITVSIVAQNFPAAALNFIVASVKKTRIHLRMKFLDHSLSVLFLTILPSLIAWVYKLSLHFPSLCFGTSCFLLVFVLVDLKFVIVKLLTL